ncbi:hypothetical protein BGZ49_008703 [Haplosporangium sp. Z 27]|nr:hypothetical protein BGZ49_008703 [Haplosporangium sp. Z 27]
MPTSIQTLLPEGVSSLLLNKPNTSSISSTAPLDPKILKAHLKRIFRSTWLRLGSDCHNTGFASEAAAALKSQKSITTSVSMFSTAATAARAAALLYDNGIPRILGTIERRQTIASAVESKSDGNVEQEISSPILWDLYLFYKQHCTSQVDLQESSYNNNTNGRNKSRKSRSTLSTIDQQPWQLEFLKSACPELVVMVFIDTYLEYGPKHGFERDLPTDLVEALDFEWRSNSGPSKRAVLALVQTLIACRRYAKNNSNSSRGSGDINQAAATSKGLGLGLELDSLTTNNAKPTSDEEEKSDEKIKNEQKHESACHQLALTMAEACTALEVFFDTERGRNLPKLITLYQQELAADTKLQSRSGQAGAGSDRGVKRLGVGTAGAGSGAIGLAGVDPMDTVARKRFKSGSNETGGILGSTQTTIGTPSSPVPSSTPTLPSASTLSTTTTNQPTVGNITFKTSSQFVDQALAGYSSTAVTQQVPATTSTLSSINAQQQAKLNNPLWSPVMGLTHLPQWPTKYAAQVESELERWISLLGHMDGAVFSEKLVGLIKSVYPSDQKFLLDQILIDYMCWEGSGGREREAEEPAFVATQYFKENLPSWIASSTHHSSNSTTGISKPDIKTGEWVMETIMSTLVSLVIKPEESSTYLEPGSKKWIEIIEVPIEVENESTNALSTNSTSAPAPGSGDGSSKTTSTTTASATATATSATTFRSSAALGGTKKRRVRNLYNRRVSPFYAVLAMFQSKRVVGRVTGMLYSSSEDLASHYDATNPAVAGPNLVGGNVPMEPGAGGVVGIDAQELLKQVGDTPAFPKQSTTQTAEPEEPEPDVLKMDRRRAKKQKRKERKILTKMRQQQPQNQRRHGPNGELIMTDLDAEEEFDTRVKLPTSGDMDIDADIAELEALKNAGDAATANSINNNNSNNNNNNNSNNAEKEHGSKRGEGEEATQMEGLEQDTSGEATSPQEETTHQDDWTGEGAEEEDALELAKQVEASRIVCQAPFKVLMFILQYLTRANQAGALDSWITDALSATLPSLQEQYFEWMLCNIIISKSTPSSSQAVSIHTPNISSGIVEGNQDQGETVVFEEELLRLLAVLVAAQGIGYDSAKSALENVDRAFQSVFESLKLDKEIQENSYWTRAKTLLDSH